MPTRNIMDAVPALRKAWKESLEEWKAKYPNEPEPFLTCVYRSNQEQEELFMMNKNGKDDDGDGKIDEADEWRTNARAGQSKHNSFPSQAIDIAFRIDKKLGGPYARFDLFAKFAEIIKSKGVKWGGDWNKKILDPPHFEI